MNARAYSQTRVAVLLPARDAERTVARAVRSALAQPEAAEVVVIDDGSTDATAQVAQACCDGSGRLRIIRQENRGPSGAVNRGYDATSSPFVCILDADDFFLPGRLAAIFRGAGGGWDLAADRLLLAREGFEDGPYEKWAGVIPQFGEFTFAEFVRGNITHPDRPRTELGYLQPLFRRAFLDGHGLRHAEDVRLGEDYLLYAEALARGARFRVTGDFNYVAVARAGSLSHRHSADDLEALLRADRRLTRLPGLTAADHKALNAHIAHVRLKWIYHRALEAKAEGDLPGALRTILGNPDCLGYLLTQTARAKLSQLRGEGSGIRSPGLVFRSVSGLKVGPPPSWRPRSQGGVEVPTGGNGGARSARARGRLRKQGQQTRCDPGADG